MSNPQDQVPEKETPEGTTVVKLPDYLSTALQMLQYPERPYGAEEVWHFSPAVDDEGKTFDFVTLTMMQPNMIYTNWFTEESLDAHIKGAINALLTMRARNKMSGKLITANQADISETVKIAKLAGIQLPGM